MRPRLDCSNGGRASCPPITVCDGGGGGGGEGHCAYVTRPNCSSRFQPHSKVSEMQIEDRSINSILNRRKLTFKNCSVEEREECGKCEQLRQSCHPAAHGAAECAEGEEEEKQQLQVPCEKVCEHYEEKIVDAGTTCAVAAQQDYLEEKLVCFPMV